MELEKFIEKYKVIAEEVNKLDSDIKRLQYLKDNSDKLMVELDNDCTSICFIDRDIWELLEEKYNITLEWFDYYHGRTDWIIELFEFAWIKAETC